MALMKGNKNSDDYKRHVRIEESGITGLLNFVVALAIAAVAYTDWIVVANVSLGYLYVLPIALSALVNPLPLTIALDVVCTVLQDIFGPPAASLPLRVAHIPVGLAGFLVVGFLVTLIAKQRDRLAAEVRRQRDEYELDLILASQVQRRSCPTLQPCPASNSRRPCRPRGCWGATTTGRLVRGDYYDFFQLSDDVVDVVIANVSGKGAAASLLMPSLD
jgi:uncharacterized membrane protein YuzA (DUF378 family)